MKRLGSTAGTCAHLKGACGACMRRAPGTRALGGTPGLSGTRGGCYSPITLPTQAMREEDPTPGTTSSGTPLRLRTPFTQIGHLYRSPRASPECTPSHSCPFPLSPRRRHPRASPLHPGPGSVQSRKTNRNSLTSLGSRLGPATPPPAAAAPAASRGSARCPPRSARRARGARLPPAPPAAGCGAAWGGVAAAPPAAQLPARPSFSFGRRPPPAPLPHAPAIGQPPPGAGPRAGAFVSPSETQALKGAGG